MFILAIIKNTPNFLPLLMMHEFTHICVEDDVKKYHLPHLAKERLVSKICSEVLDFDDHNQVGDKAIDKFFSKENLVNNYNYYLTNVEDYYKKLSVQGLTKFNNKEI